MTMIKLTDSPPQAHYTEHLKPLCPIRPLIISSSREHPEAWHWPVPATCQHHIHIELKVKKRYIRCINRSSLPLKSQDGQQVKPGCSCKLIRNAVFSICDYKAQLIVAKDALKDSASLLLSKAGAWVTQGVADAMPSPDQNDGTLATHPPDPETIPPIAISSLPRQVSPPVKPSERDHYRDPMISCLCRNFALVPGVVAQYSADELAERMVSLLHGLLEGYLSMCRACIELEHDFKQLPQLPKPCNNNPFDVAVNAKQLLELLLAQDPAFMDLQSSLNHTTADLIAHQRCLYQAIKPSVTEFLMQFNPENLPKTVEHKGIVSQICSSVKAIRNWPKYRALYLRLSDYGYQEAHKLFIEAFSQYYRHQRQGTQ